MTHKHKISEVRIIPFSKPALSKVQLYELDWVNGVEQRVCFFEDEGVLEKLLEKYSIASDGEAYDIRHLKNKICVIVDHQIQFI